jgi:hypothetical protein
MRHFWIDPIAKGRSFIDGTDLFSARAAAPKKPEQFIHVIEYSAYEQMKADRQILLEALTELQKEADHYIDLSSKGDAPVSTYTLGRRDTWEFVSDEIREAIAKVTK